MAVYILHFEPPYKHAAHYIGWSPDNHVEQRLADHVAGKGSRLTQVAVQAGCKMVVAEIIMGGDKAMERRLKNRHCSSRFCPICRGR